MKVLFGCFTVIIIFLGFGALPGADAQEPEPVSELEEQATADGEGKEDQTGSLPADTEGEIGEEDVPELPWVRMMVTLGLIVVLLLGGGWMLKKYGGARFGNGRYLKVVEVVPLGNRMRLALVVAGDRALVLACTEKSVEKVIELDQGQLDLEDFAENGQTSGFAEVLGRLTNRSES